MHSGAELRQELVEIHADYGVIAKEIRSAQRIVVANVVVHFAKGVF
jgi:hypothetical protein